MLPIVEVIHKGPFLGSRFYLAGFVKEDIEPVAHAPFDKHRLVAVVASMDTGIFREFLAEHVRLMVDDG
jgi:hypothetical protein